MDGSSESKIENPIQLVDPNFYGVSARVESMLRHGDNANTTLAARTIDIATRVLEMGSEAQQTIPYSPGRSDNDDLFLREKFNAGLNPVDVCRVYLARKAYDRRELAGFTSFRDIEEFLKITPNITELWRENQVLAKRNAMPLSQKLKDSLNPAQDHDNLLVFRIPPNAVASGILIVPPGGKEEAIVYSPTWAIVFDKTRKEAVVGKIYVSSGTLSILQEQGLPGVQWGSSFFQYQP